MLEDFDAERLTNSPVGEMEQLIEAGNIIHFPVCPIDLPTEEEFAQLRTELPKQLKLKNVSYHPEAGTVRGLDPESSIKDLVQSSLVNHSARVSEFLLQRMPKLFRNALVGTCSFRPMEEQGRNLKAHASNELIHIDAGAYGATNGDRILRFFVNYNTTADRVWATRGAFPELFEQYGSAAGLDDVNASNLHKGPLGHLRTGALKGIDKLGLPVSRALDSSPYDRAMRKFHNFMKDTPSFQSDPAGRVEMHFKPGSAWMVLTDMVSHACLSGQHCINYTALLPLEDCQHPNLAPYNILAGSQNTSSQSA
ncbi:MAG: Kdo hydroxylase family protein [Gammaproteobacteria bacterium]